MKTLKEAWDWYQSAGTNLKRMQRLASRHWNDASLVSASIWTDERFKNVDVVTFNPWRR
jgi:hypothetical protein